MRLRIPLLILALGVIVALVFLAAPGLDHRVTDTFYDTATRKFPQATATWLVALRDLNRVIDIGFGVVLEGSVTNVWWRHGQVLRTPALDLGILAGVTRQAVLELAGPCGYQVEEGAFPLTDLAGADEVFSSSSVREILPVVELDGRHLDQGPAAAVRQQALRERAAKV